MTTNLKTSPSSILLCSHSRFIFSLFQKCIFLPPQTLNTPFSFYLSLWDDFFCHEKLKPLEKKSSCPITKSSNLVASDPSTLCFLWCDGWPLLAHVNQLTTVHGIPSLPTYLEFCYWKFSLLFCSLFSFSLSTGSFPLTCRHAIKSRSPWKANKQSKLPWFYFPFSFCPFLCCSFGKVFPFAHIHSLIDSNQALSPPVPWSSSIQGH